jgi:hypothetical protein
MFAWGKSYASYLVAKGEENCEYKPGRIFDNMDELVSNECE